MVTVAPGSFLTVGAHSYMLKQFHFHHPSEERIDGQPAFDPDPVYGREQNPSFSPDPSGIFEWIYHAPSGTGANLLPPVVMFGNSFLDHYVTAGIQSYLSAVYRARNNDKNLSTVLTNLPDGTRYFVYNFLEPRTNAIGQYEIPERGDSAAH